MVSYNLSHLNQANHQVVIGPIQDDEALLLFSVIRVMRLKNIIEIGGLNGYSAQNFIKAVGVGGKVVTIDVAQTPKMGDSHTVLVKDVSQVEPDELGMDSVDLVFFDAHAYEPQIVFYNKMVNSGVINKKTIIALHDTGEHSDNFLGWCYMTDQGFVHQATERKMVNALKEVGWDAICFHKDTKVSSEHDDLPFRHGLTLMRQFTKLSV